MISRDTIEAGANRCIQLEDTDHCEHAVVFAPNGKLLFEHHGTEHTINFSKYEQNGMMVDAHTVVHNHPANEQNPEGGGSLSPQDVMFATTHNVEIWAVGRNGNRYWSKGFLQDNSKNDEYAKLMARIISKSFVGDSVHQNFGQNMLLAMQYEDLMGVVSRDLFKYAKGMYADPSIGEAEFYEIAGHACNLAARKIGLIDYHWELSKKTQAIFDKFLPFINRRAGGDIYAIDKKSEKARAPARPSMEDMVAELLGILGD